MKNCYVAELFPIEERAEVEFNKAIEYYESREEGLGFDFAHEGCTVIDNI